MMSRYRPYIVLGMGALMALVTSLLVFNWLAQFETPQVQKVSKQQVTMVAVAVEGEPWGTELVVEIMKLVPYPKHSLPEGHFSSLEPLKGRVLIARVTANEPILESKLAPLSVTTGGVAAVTNPQKRAMAVKVDSVVGVAGFINPGNRVDVLVALKLDPPITKIVLQNILVLATGTEIERRGKEQKPFPVKVITLEVTPQCSTPAGIVKASPGFSSTSFSSPRKSIRARPRRRTTHSVLSCSSHESAGVVCPWLTMRSTIVSRPCARMSKISSLPATGSGSKRFVGSMVMDRFDVRRRTKRRSKYRLPSPDSARNPIQNEEATRISCVRHIDAMRAKSPSKTGCLSHEYH